MGIEPEIPTTDQDLPKDPIDIDRKTTPEDGNSKASENGDDNKSGQGEEELEQVKKSQSEQLKKLTSAWNEDREYFKGEIKRLRTDANNPKLSQKEEDELEGLDEDERIEKIIEFRKNREKKADEAELEAVKSEIRYYRVSSPEFAKNEKAILRVAEDYDSPTLKQAILIWRGLNIDKANKDAKYNDKRKKEADGRAGGGAGGKVTGKPYNPKTDKNKSFSDFYREGGL